MFRFVAYRGGMTFPDVDGRRGGGRLGRYRLAHRIGEGGSGVVYVGLDDEGRAYAIKVLRPHVAGEPDARRRLAREVETLQRVRHPAIAEVIDADIDSTTPYIVTRYVPARSLHDVVSDHGPFHAADLIRLGNGMGQALAAIHSVGVVHRDLKPGNVLVENGDPVLIDFGIAHIVDDTRLTQHGMVMGTPGYLAPELLAGNPVTAATDWWSWAATMAFAASGRPPFGADRTEAVLERVRTGEPDLHGVPEALVDVLRRALSPDADTRPRPRELRTALLDLQADTGDWESTRAITTLGDGRTGASTESAAGTQEAPTGRQSPARTDATAVDDAPVETIVLPLDGPRARAGERAAKAWTPAVVPLPGVEKEAAARAWNTPPSGSVIHPPSGTLAAVADGEASATSPPPSASPPPTAAAAPSAGTGLASRLWSRASGRSATATRAAEHPTVVHRTDPPTRVQPVVQRHAPHPPYGTPRPSNVQPPPARGTYPPHGGGGYPVPVRDHAAPPVAHQGQDARGGGHGSRGSSPGPYPPPRTSRSGSLFLTGLALSLAAAIVPGLVLCVWTVVGVLARTVDRTQASLMRRRFDRGPSRSDSVVAALRSPWHLLTSVVVTAGYLILPLMVSVSVTYLTSVFTGRSSTGIAWSGLTLVAGAAALLVAGWWGPGGSGLRRGTRSIVRKVSPTQGAAQVFGSVMALLAVAAAILLWRNGADASMVDWVPFTGSPSTWFQ